MRKVIVQEFVSIDGLAADANDGVDFVPASTQGDKKFGDRQLGFMDSMVIWGSLSLAQALAKEGLIDEYQLIVCPVVLGSGRSLFGDKVGMHQVKLLTTMSFDRGAVLLGYAATTARSTA